jgi:hypothetical protein
MKTAIAGAVVYKIAIKTNAYPADFLASFTLLTVKNEQLRAVIIKALVLQSTSTIDFVPFVYTENPRSVESRLVYPIDKCRFPELASIPNCGTGFPVI